MKLQKLSFSINTYASTSSFGEVVSQLVEKVLIDVIEKI